MKIAVVSMRFDRRGGSERRTWHLVDGLLDAGHEVEVFTARAEDGDTRAKVNIVPMLPGPSFVKVASFTANVNRMLDKRPDIDVVHNQIRPFTDGVVTVGGGCHAEYLAGRRGMFKLLNPLNRVILGMERKRYRPGGCRAVITNSEFAREGILRHYPMPPERVFVAYNGVDLAKFSPESAAAHRAEVRASLGLKDEPVALFLGSGFERKGLKTAIMAIPVLKDMANDIRRIRLIVVGGDDPRPYISLAKKYGAADRVTFAGPTDAPERLYGAADVFVLPTYYDPFSNAALEAMACGLPVVTTRQNGVSEIIEDGVDGFIISRPDDHMGLASALAYLSCEKARAEVGTAARLKAEGFTWDNTLRKTLDVYAKR